MGHVTFDDDLLAQLSGFVEPVEIRDAEGRLLGHYTPHVTEEMRREHAEAAASFDLDEARRRLAAHKPGEGRTTEEVLARLNALGSPK